MDLKYFKDKVKSEKEEIILNYLGGANYNFSDLGIETTGDLKKVLQVIIEDLPEDNKLYIDELLLKDNRLEYILSEPTLNK